MGSALTVRDCIFEFRESGSGSAVSACWAGSSEDLCQAAYSESTSGDLDTIPVQGAGEGFEYPVARILSETGRRSRSPVFVVGIYSGNDQLGEGAGASLPEARLRASVNALKAWYLYSPGNNVPVPSDTESANARPWEPVHIDIGEVIH